MRVRRKLNLGQLQSVVQVLPWVMHSRCKSLQAQVVLTCESQYIASGSQIYPQLYLLILFCKIHG